MLNRATSVSILQHPIFWAIVWFFLSMGIQCIGLDTLSLTSDECFSIYHAQMSPRLIYHHLSTGNNPPLYEWILHFWMQFFGDSAFSVRFLSLIFSSLTTSLIFLLGTKISTARTEGKWGRWPIATWASILFLSSNYSTFLAHEARAYNLTLFLGLLSTLAFLRALQHGGIRHFFFYGIAGGFLCLSHFFGIWILLAQGSFWLWQKKLHSLTLKSFFGWFLGFGISFGWYLPNLWFRFVESASQGTWVNPAPWDAPYLTLWKYLNTPIATVIGMILLIKPTFDFFKKTHQPSENYQKLIFWLFALPFFGQWLMSLDHPFSIPMFTERYASITLPFICLSLSMSVSNLSQLWGKKVGVLAASLLWIFMGFGKIFTPPNFAAARESLQRIEEVTKDTAGKVDGQCLQPKSQQTPLIIEPYHAAFQVLYYKDHKRFTEYHPNLIYEHLATQLSHSNVWILRTSKGLDSLGLSQVKKLAYLHLGTEKSAHTQMIEKQLEKLTQHGGNQHRETIQLPKWLWGTWKDQSEAEFWLIDKN